MSVRPVTTAEYRLLLWHLDTSIVALALQLHEAEAVCLQGLAALKSMQARREKVAAVLEKRRAIAAAGVVDLGRFTIADGLACALQAETRDAERRRA